MFDQKTSHIAVSYKEGSDEVTLTFAVNEGILRRLGREKEPPTGKSLQEWLEQKRCKLDNPDGPARVKHYDIGSTVTEYHRDGKLHREDGPAYILRLSDGSTVEFYYRNDKRVTPLSVIPSVTVQRPAPKAPDRPGALGPA